MALFFEDTGAAELQLFENGAETPTWSKTVSWNWDCGEGCECGEDQAFCEGACIDVKEDPENCGGCGVTCGDDQMCIDHACVP